VDAGPERYEWSQQRRVGARDVLRVLLPERSGGYRFLQVLAGPDSFSHRFNQLTQIGQVTTQDRPRSQRQVPRNNCPHLERVRELCHRLQVCARPTFDQKGNGPFTDDQVARPGDPGLGHVDDGVAGRIAVTEVVEFHHPAAQIQLQVLIEDQIREA
jgi:hypothetical protein